MAEFVGEGFFGEVGGGFGYGEEVDLRDIVLEEGVGYCVAYALGAACYDGYFAGEGGTFGEGELGCAEFGDGAAEIFGKGVL